MKIMRSGKAITGNEIRVTYDQNRIMGKYRVDFKREGEYGWRYAASYDTAGEAFGYYDKMMKGGR